MSEAQTTLTAALVLQSLAQDDALTRRAAALVASAGAGLTTEEHRICVVEAARVTAAAKHGRVR